MIIFLKAFNEGKLVSRQSLQALQTGGTGIARFRHPVSNMGMGYGISRGPDRWVQALEQQQNGEWRYLEFLQVTSLITAGIFVRETRGRHRVTPS